MKAAALEMAKACLRAYHSSDPSSAQQAIAKVLEIRLEKLFSELTRKLEVAESAIASLETLEPVESSFEGRWMESQYDGFCKDCGIPYAVGQLVWWLGTGRGAYCEGCQKASEWAKTKKVSGGRNRV